MDGLPPGATVDRYSVVRRLGSGGMADVYLALHEQLGTRHALKLLKVPFAAVQERLVLEGRLQAALKHPNIVSVTDIIQVGGSPALVMEYVEGVPLDVLIRHGDLDWAQIDALGRQILGGVVQAHRRGSVHRDLKPGNVLVDLSDRSPVAKIADFGLAKMIFAEDGLERIHQTRSGATMGTPCYMAPEQFRNAKHVDARADVWALGAVLYELVSGRQAFDGADLVEIMVAVTEGRRIPIRHWVDDIPRRMEEAIEAALVVDPERRVRTAEELLDLWTGKSHGAKELYPVWDMPRLRLLDPVALEPTQLAGPRAAGTFEPSRSPSPTVVPTLDESSVEEAGLEAVAATPAAAPRVEAVDRRGAFAVAVGGALFVLVLAGIWVADRQTPVPAAPAPVAQPAPAPEVVEPPARKPKRPRRAAASPAPQEASFRVSGQIPVELRRDERTFSAGALPPGDYEIWARFGETWAAAGSATVAAGASLTVECEPSTLQCSAR